MALFSYVLAFLYVASKSSQFFSTGPEWFRFYVSDLGFVAAIGVLLPEQIGNFSSRLGGWVRKHHTKLVCFVLAGALLSELLQGVAADWIDLLCFVAGAIPPFLHARSR